MRVLVANRGEIAVRILRACRDLGVQSVAVHSEVDKEALHVRYADEAVLIGPAAASQSYSSIPAILEAARRSGATAIHPGYGFLSENADFARAVEEAGLIFIGPRSETIAMTSDKLIARKVAREVGLPVLPGPDTPLIGSASSGQASQVSFPVLVKATAGGGGRGIRLANSREELAQMITVARTEAQATFGDDTIYLEPLVRNARHIEVQILGDGDSHILCLGERECSIQRRRQKLIEESPAFGLSDAQRDQIFGAALRLGCALKYRSLGTVEFLLDANGGFHFIEVNPRIQVEHPVTEMVTGMDLVKEQIRLAGGRLLRHRQEYITSRGSAIEARVVAEDPSMGFIPATGSVSYLKEPGGPGIRVDSALYHGMDVTADYDSLLAKVISWGESRAVAIMRMRRALREFKIGGIVTDLEFLFQVINSTAFFQGNTDTTFLDTFQSTARTEADVELERDVALAAALLTHRQKAVARVISADQNGWRATAWREQMAD